MTQRYKDALACNDGAINPVAICNAIIRAVKEIDGEKGDRLNDPAVVIMVHQLASITGAINLSTERYCEHITVLTSAFIKD